MSRLPSTGSAAAADATSIRTSPVQPATPSAGATQPPGQPFTLYASAGRVLCSNKRDKLVDLGTLEAGGSEGAEDGAWRYQLDGDDTITASGFPSAEEALADLAGAMTFLFLDGQFTALADVGEGGRPELADATQIHITLDPLGHGSTAIAADV